MEVAWSQLREEARRLAQDIGQSGREHHSLANSRVIWDAIRAHGVPSEHREWVWPILLHDQSMKLQRQQTEGTATYSQLLNGMTEELQEKAADPDTNNSLEQAQEEAMERFHHLNPFQERKIRRILLAYAKSKDAFYYCHGMVESCVVLSTFLVEEDAFWSFRMLLEVLLPKYFDESVVDFHTDCLVLQELLRAHDPALSEHFSVLGVSIQLLCTKWFFSFFAESMPFEVVCRLYDTMFVDICSRQLGSKIIFSTSLAVLLYLSSTLVEIQDVKVVLEIINEFCRTTLNEYSVAESFLDLINFMHEQIDDEQLAALREKYRAQLAQEEEQRKTLQRKIQTKKSSKKLKVDKAGSAEELDQPRKGRIQSIKLLIQWKKHMIDNPDASTGQARKRISSRVSSSDSSEKLRCGRNSRTRSREQESSSSSSDSEGSEEAGLEIVTTPSEKEMMARVYQGISKINRRRSRTSSSMRNFSLKGADGTLSSMSSRSLSLSNSILSNTSSTKGDDVDVDPEDEDTLWETLRVSGSPKAVVRHSMNGVPDAYRSWVWPILINQLPAPPDLPQNLAGVKNEDEEALLDREVAKSIENDITRTRNLRNDQFIPMRRVLTAFANRNRRVGYCQGMNEILVVLLQYLDEDQALRALILLIEVLLPAYHVDSMIGLHTDCAVMNTLLRQNDAELHAHLNELGLNMEILCTKWLVTCFLTSLPSFCGLKVIDMLLSRAKEKQRASRVLLGVGISIFFTLRETLLEAKDAGEVLLAINEYFAREMTKTTVEMDKFLHFCLLITDQLEPDIVEEFRLVHKDEVMERFAAFEAKKIEMRQQLEEAKAKQRKVASAPPSPSKSDRLSTLSASGIMSGKSNGQHRKSGLSSYISNPLRGSGGSKTTTTNAGDDKESRKRYQRVDVLQTHHSFSEDLEKMEDQLEDLGDLYLRGKIDEKEHSCIRAQIVRKWCKGMNSPQSAMVRVQCVKHTYCERSGGEEFANSAPGLLEGPVRNSFTGEADIPHRGRKGSISLYGRMKKAQKTPARRKQNSKPRCFVTCCNKRKVLLDETQRMRWPNQPGIDDTFLEELLLPGSSRSGVKLSSQASRLSMDLPRKRGSRRNKASDYPINSPATVVRQALFPSGPGSYPSQITPLSKPSESRQHKSTRQQDNWAFSLSNEHKWREMGWNTSTPAEYVLQTNSKDYMLTLAYSEDLMQRQGGLAPTDVNGSGSSKSPVKTTKGGSFTRSPSFSNTTTTATTRGIAEVGSAQTEEERTLLKNTMLREGLLAKLHALVKAATPTQSLLQPKVPPKEPVFDVSKGTEVLHLLLQLRDVGVLVLESILRWHELRVRLAPMVPLVPFRFENHNYCGKMLTDLNFLSSIKTLGTVLGINPSTMKQNPFMMPAPIPERDFRGLRDQPWGSLRLFLTKRDSIQRVADAEKYLVWCLFNLQDAPAPASPTRSAYDSNSPTSSSVRKREQQQKMTWQKRAERQLEMLSMPLESLSGPTYLQDSSKMMKRKGVLPSLPQSPPKNLRELMGNVQLSGGEEPYDHCDNNRSKILLVRWSGEEFSATSADCEALGALEAPPHHMVTLVTASVLILLSPADQLPKDLSWPSCQKMLQRGRRLIQRVRSFDVAGVPAFKWKALVPFLQNEHFQPTFLAQFSCAASAMCAWVFSVLRAAQQQDYKRMGVHTSDGLDAVGEEDRLELLSELEVEASSPQSRDSPTRADEEMLLPPLTHSRSGKRVSIGNAAVLFINENQPVIMSTSRTSSRSSSRRGECSATTKKSKFTVSSLHSSGESNALLRTSPWTYRGVVYFVSFFIQQYKERSQQQEDEEAEDSDGRRLMIKMYEPMSSVESQMSVDRDDLRQDFGEEALVAFQCGQYRTLCDLMLRQLDRMMGADSSKHTPLILPPPGTEDNTHDGGRNQVSAVDLLLQGESEEDRPELVDEPIVKDLPVRSQAEGDLDLEVSALKIQCAARQQQARNKVNRVRAQKEQEEVSVLRIQCAARQKQARWKVDRLRAEKKRIETVPETEELCEDTTVEDPTLVQVAGPESRPGTVLSYTSDQFENDIEVQE